MVGMMPRNYRGAEGIPLDPGQEARFEVLGLFPRTDTARARKRLNVSGVMCK